MSHRCYMCNRTDDPAVALSPFDIFKGSYSEVRGDPTKEICSDCNHAYLSSLMEMDVPKSRTHQIVETEDSYEVDYDPDVDDYSDDYEDFDYTNYDIYDDVTPEAVDHMRQKAKSVVGAEEWEVIDGFGRTSR